MFFGLKLSKRYVYYFENFGYNDYNIFARKCRIKKIKKVVSKLTLKDLLSVLDSNIKWDLIVNDCLVLTKEEDYLNNTIKYIGKDNDFLRICVEE